MASQMTKIISMIFKEQEHIVLGQSSMNDQMDYPLRLAYTNVFICREGQAIININFKSYALKKNDILVLSEGAIAIIVRKSKKFKLFYCMIDKSYASEVAYNLPNQLFSFLHKSPRCIPEKSEWSLLNIWLEQAQYIMQTTVTYRHIMMRNHLQNFFLLISEKMPENSHLIQREYSRKEKLCWAFWDLVGKHCSEHRHVSFYAKALCITPFYLSQITKDFFNDSPKELINRQVILEMKALLNFSELSIKMIADQLHFEDPSYMCRYFKRQTGITLSAYRK